MNEITSLMKKTLFAQGADIVGFGDISEIPGEMRHGLPFGISVAVLYPKHVISGITEGPTMAYRENYYKLTEKVDNIVKFGADFLIGQGYKAVAQTKAQVRKSGDYYNTLLPHKTVATRAGLGWIGKCALLVTEDYGSMFRLSSILTDAPLETAQPVNESKCGECMECAKACPGNAVSGRIWELGLERNDFYDHIACAKAAVEQAKKAGLGGDDEICGRCIAVCPYTIRYYETTETCGAVGSANV